MKNEVLGKISTGENDFNSSLCGMGFIKPICFSLIRLSSEVSNSKSRNARASLVERKAVCQEGFPNLL